MLRGLIAVCLCFAHAVLAQAPLLDAKAPYTFTDQPVRLPVAATGELALTVRTLTVAGWGPSAEVKAPVQDGAVTVTPLAEGLHIVTCAALPQLEARFLALAPPPAVAATAVPAWLMQQPLTLLSMGDSVTATGDYETLLAMLLRRAIGNPAIVTAERAYSGRSVDASVRNFDDALATRPAAAFIMYGLNDQGAGCSLRAYVEQTRWLAKRLRDEAGTRVYLLSPTPDLSRPKDVTDYGPYLFRTLGFAAALPAAAHDTGAVCVDTFQALWGQGGADLNAAARAMWPLYPRSYRQQLSSIVETDGQGDGVHPNALGHLQFAKAIYRAMLGQPEPPAPLAYVADSGVTNGVMTTTVTCTNVSGQPRTGTLTFYPMPDGELACADDPRYDLAPGASRTYTLAWPSVEVPYGLLIHPYRQYHRAGTVPASSGSLAFVVSDLVGQGCQPTAVYAPQVSPICHDLIERQSMTEAAWWMSYGPADRNGRRIAIPLPVEVDVGRQPSGGWGGPTDRLQGAQALEVSYCRLGAALAGEATVDGDLAEWAAHVWRPLGEPVQARWTRGQEDHRATPADCYLRWSMKAGQAGLYLAANATGKLEGDSFNLFFDPRAPELLGTPGRYYWVNGKVDPNGKLKLSRGETSPKLDGLAGAWRATADGLALELFVPYGLLEVTAWPAAGDLGFDLWWRHPQPDGGKTTHLLWCSDGHPWNTLGYGIVRLVTDPAQPLPFLLNLY